MALRLRDRLRPRPGRLTWEMIERIIAGAVMVNLALLTAFALRFLSFFVLGAGQDGGAPYRPTLASSGASGGSIAATPGC